MAQFQGNVFSLVSQSPQASWLHGQAFASASAGATQHRGLDLSAEIDVQGNVTAKMRDGVEASFGLGGDIHAGLRLTSAFPLDLFKQAGLLARLQARLEAAAFVNAEVGLEMAVFRTMLRQRLRGAWLELTDVFFEQLVISAGLWGKAAFAAEIVAEAAAIGSLLPSPDGRTAGFTFSFHYGAGFMYGTGLHFLTNIGFVDSRLLINNLSDKLVAIIEDDLEQALKKLPAKDIAAARQAMVILKMVLPLASRSAFDLGIELVTHPPSKAKSTATTRTVASFVREAQEWLLRSLIDLAIRELSAVLNDPAIEQRLKELVGSDREQVVSMLGRIRSFLGKFDKATATSPSQWLSTVITLLDPIMGVLQTKLLTPAQQETWKDHAALLWCAAVLTRRLVDWIDADRAKNGALHPENPFDATPAIAPRNGAVGAYVTAKLNRVPGSQLTLGDLVLFLLQKNHVPALYQAFPELGIVLDWITKALGKGQDKLLLTLFRDLTAISPRSAASLLPSIIREVGVVIDEQVVPRLLNPLEKRGGELAEVSQQILRPTVLSLTRVVLPGIGRLDQKDPGIAERLREQMSAVLLQFLTRFMLIAVDILLDHALTEGGRGLHRIADDVEGRGRDDIFNLLTAIATVALFRTPMLPGDVAEVLHLSADTIEFWNKRDRKPLVDLMGTLITLGLTTGNKELDRVWTTLGSSSNAPPMEDKLRKLAQEVEREGWELLLFVVPRAAELWLHHWERLARELVRLVERGAKEIIKGVQDAARFLDEEIPKLEREVARLAKEVDAAANAVAAEVGAFSNHLLSLQDSAISAVHDAGWQVVRRGLFDNFVFKAVGRPGWVEIAVKGIYDRVFAAARVLLDAPLQLLSVLAQWLHDEVVAAISAGTLNRQAIVDRLRGRAFGAHAHAIEIPIRVTVQEFKVAGIKVGETTVDLGTIRIEAQQVLGAIAGMIFKDRKVNASIDKVVAKGRGLAVKQPQLAARQAALRGDLSKSQARETLASLFTGKDLEVRIVSPDQDRTYAGTAKLRVVVAGANGTFATSVLGVPTRIKLSLNGQEYRYAAQDWVETAEGLTLTAQVAASNVGLIPQPVTPPIKLVPLHLPPGFRLLREDGGRVAPGLRLEPRQEVAASRNLEPVPRALLMSPKEVSPLGEIRRVAVSSAYRRAGVRPQAGGRGAVAVAERPAPREVVVAERAAGTVPTPEEQATGYRWLTSAVRPESRRELTIVGRPGLNTIQVIVADGKGKQAQSMRVFFLKETKKR